MSRHALAVDDLPGAASEYIPAILNILEDSAEEQASLRAAQRAVVNILEDANSEAEQASLAVRATLNILEDLSAERSGNAAVQAAMLNILDDFSEERNRLGDMQRAILNILDDFGLEKIKADRAYRDVEREVAVRSDVERALEEAKARTDAANDALEQTNAQLESFSYSVAHDLRAPLRAVDGFSQLLLEDHASQLDAEGRRLLEVVTSSVARMARLIDDLLAFSRLGRSVLAIRPVDMTGLAGAVARQLQDEAPSLAVDVVVEPLPQASGDPALLEQVWRNLVGNALKFTMHTPEARVVISGEPGSAFNTYSVADNGAGFDMRYVDKLFGVFQRLHGTTEFEGTGIGLAIVERVVKRHGGSVQASGEVGRGATVSFSLPATGGSG